MSKKIEYNVDARQKLLDGATKLADAVVSTLGPFGRNVIFNDGNEIRSTKDGVTVARSITLEDPIENMGAEIIKQAAVKSATSAGDGTTTTTLLAHSLISEGLTSIKVGANATAIKKEIDIAVSKVVSELKFISENITSPEQLQQIATISSNNDETTGKLVALALEEVGREGVVSVEESKTGDTKLELVEGMQFDRGYLSPYFVTNNNTMQAVLDEPYILIYDGILTSVKELLPILENISQSNKSLLIVAENVDGEALSTLLVNKVRGIMKVAAVKAPDFGERKTLLLEDLAVLTGGKVISKNKGLRLDKTNLSDLGTASKITITKDKTTIIDGKGSADDIKKRAEEIKNQLEKAQTHFETEKLQERLAKLTSGIAVIHVGGANDMEIKEYKDRVEDALFATKAAIEEGIVPGGGVALFKAREVLKDNKSIGALIVYKALSKPFSQILINAGKEDVAEYKVALKALSDPWMGYNLKTDQWVNMKSDGIIDPTKVVRLALENAAAVAGVVLTTQAIIYTPLEKTKKETQEDY